MAKLRIRELAKERGITMAEIADRIGINPVNLSSSINGNPTLNRLQEVADVLQVDITELFEKENKSEVYGYLEVNGEVRKITSVQDLENLVQKFIGK